MGMHGKAREYMQKTVQKENYLCVFVGGDLAFKIKQKKNK